MTFDNRTGSGQKSDLSMASGVKADVQSSSDCIRHARVDFVDMANAIEPCRTPVVRQAVCTTFPIVIPQRRFPLHAIFFGNGVDN